MWQMIKAFFGSKILKIVAWVVLAVSVALLIVAGVSSGTITSFISSISSAVAAASGLLAFISERLGK